MATKTRGQRGQPMTRLLPKSALAKTVSGLIGFANEVRADIAIRINVIGIMIAILETERDTAVVIPQIVTNLADVLIA